MPISKEIFFFKLRLCYQYLQKFIVWFLFFLTFAVLCLYIFMRVNGKNFVETQFKILLQREVKASDVRFIFPVGLRIDDLWIQGILRVKEARVFVGIPAVFGKKDIIISKLTLTEPAFILQKTRDYQFVVSDRIEEVVLPGSDAGEKEGKEGKKSIKSASEKLLSPGQSWLKRFVIRHFEIKNGEAQFVDYSDPAVFKAGLSKINLKAQDFPIPLQSYITKFNLTTSIGGEDIPFSGTVLHTQGWINIHDRDLDGKLKIVEPNGMMGLSADLEAKSNDLTVTGKMNLNSLVKRLKKSEDSGDEPSFEDLLIESIHMSGIEMELDFNIKTKLDNFEVDKIAFSGTVGSGPGASFTDSFKIIGRKLEAMVEEVADSAPQNMIVPPAVPTE